MTQPNPTPEDLDLIVEQLEQEIEEDADPLLTDEELDRLEAECEAAQNHTGLSLLEQMLQPGSVYQILRAQRLSEERGDVCG